MPYKDKLKQQQAQHESYVRNKDKIRSKHQRRVALKRKWFFEEVLSKRQCLHCGEPDPVVLEFHHIDPSQKDGNISDLVKDRKSKERILAEVNKCIVLCANCHRRLHSLDRVTFGLVDREGVEPSKTAF